MKRNKQLSENFLEKIPKHSSEIGWNSEEDNLVTLSIENKGFFNKIAQKFFKKPKISYIHLDELGSFIWRQINGKKTVHLIGESVEEFFGEKAHPLYERLLKFFQILESYNFISWEEKDNI